jgi:hypothetical protein
MIAYVQKGVFLCLIAGDGGAQILHQGRRFERAIPQAEWDCVLAGNYSRTGFECDRCNEPVFSATGAQSCRCSYVRHAPGYEFTSGLEWEQWQGDFDRELRDPAPDPYWVRPVLNTDGVPTATDAIMTAAAKAWFKRKFGLPAELEISDDGHTLRLPGVAGVLSIGKNGNISTVYDDDDTSDGSQFSDIAKRLNAARESVPPMMVVLGDDPDYVWPLINKRSIRPLPFSCSRCSRRVKRAPLGLGELLVCYCMQAGFGPRSKKRPPRSRLEWDALRVESATQKARVKTVGRSQELNASDSQKTAEDVADRAHKMPRGSALLYRNRTPKDSSSAHYRGLTRLPNGDVYWIGLWLRSLNGERVLEVRLVPKT